MGSIHASLLPNVVMLARVCRDFAIRVRVRLARGSGCSGEKTVSSPFHADSSLPRFCSQQRVVDAAYL